MIYKNCEKLEINKDNKKTLGEYLKEIKISKNKKSIFSHPLYIRYIY